MSSSLIDLPLDEIVKKRRDERKANKRSGAARSGARDSKRDGGNSKREAGDRDSGRKGSRGGRSRGRGGNRPAPYRRPDRSGIDEDWSHDKFSEDGKEPETKSDITKRVSTPRAKTSAGHKIKIENLRYDVTVEDLKELFSSVGSVLDAGIKFDKSGRSTGSAWVTFRIRDDARAAVEKYNGKAIDGDVMAITLEPLQLEELEGSGSASTKKASAKAADNSKYADLDDIRISVSVQKK